MVFFTILKPLKALREYTRSGEERREGGESEHRREGREREIEVAARVVGYGFNRK